MSSQSHEKSCSQLGGFLVGLLVGGLAGAAAMLLMAPESGKKTRSRIEKKGKQLQKQFVRSVEDTTAQVRDKAQQITDGVAEQAGDLQQRGQDAIDEKRDLLGDSLKDLGKAVHS
jgi:gas vesicle protein